MLGELTLSPADCAAILGVVELRLGYPPQKWRNVYKGLTVLEYLLRHGSDACVDRARRGLLPRLEALSTGFTRVGADGRDTGVNVRHRWVLAAGAGCWLTTCALWCVVRVWHGGCGLRRLGLRSGSGQQLCCPVTSSPAAHISLPFHFFSFILLVPFLP